MILATRPVLLYVLSTKLQAEREPHAQQQSEIPENVQAIAEACVRCARHSYSLLMECWVDGSFATFDYFNTQYLFSAATVLATSALLGGTRSSKDKEDFELATQLLDDLKRNGSFSATEFCQHIEAVKASTGVVPSQHQNQDQSNTITSTQTDIAYQFTELSYPDSLMTAEMALAEPSVQAFLSQTDPSLQHMDLSMVDDGLGGFYWPDS